MKHLSPFLLLLLIACDQTKKSNPHSTDYTSQKSGGLVLPNGDYAKYHVTADEESIAYTIEVSENGLCWLGKGSDSVREYDRQNENGKYRSYPNLMVQIATDFYELESNFKFVHFVVLKNQQSQIPCTGSLGEKVDDTEYQELASNNYFSAFDLDDHQKKLAGEAFLTGSTKRMLLFRKPELGAVVDSTTRSLIGISVPKYMLKTGFVFGTNTLSTDVANIPEGTPFPLIFSSGDEDLNRKTRQFTEQYADAVKQCAGLPEHRKKMILRLVWNDYFSNQNANRAQP